MPFGIDDAIALAGVATGFLGNKKQADTQRDNNAAAIRAALAGFIGPNGSVLYDEGQNAFEATLSPVGKALQRYGETQDIQSAQQGQMLSARDASQQAGAFNEADMIARLVNQDTISPTDLHAIGLAENYRKHTGESNQIAEATATEGFRQGANIDPRLIERAYADRNSRIRSDAPSYADSLQTSTGINANEKSNRANLLGAMLNVGRGYPTSPIGYEAPNPAAYAGNAANAGRTIAGLQTPPNAMQFGGNTLTALGDWIKSMQGSQYQNPRDLQSGPRINTPKTNTTY